MLSQSQRIRTIEPSATLAMNSLRLELAAQGREIINFSVGEPDFDTPEYARQAAAEAVENGWTRYTATPGVKELREAIAKREGERRGIEIGFEEVIVTAGGKQSLANAILGLVDPGDEVLLPAPYWVSYPEMIGLAEGITVVVPTTREDGYRVSIEQLESMVTPRTSGIILNSPSNPTGSVYSPEQVDQIVEFAERHDIWILSDEIYEPLVFEGEFASPLSGSGRSRTVLSSGVAKSFAMTGWRIGWAIAEPEFIKAMIRLQSHTTSNAAAVSQAAALAAVSAPDDAFLTGMVEAFRKRRLRAFELLGEIPGVRFHRPEGAFYIFLDLEEILTERSISANDLCMQLLDKAGVALVPGEAFGDPNGARLSYACSTPDLEAGLAAIRDYLAG